MNNLILTPNIARGLLDIYWQFTKGEKTEVDGLNFQQFQQLLVAYGQLYFNTKDTGVVLEELKELSELNGQRLPTAAVPNTDKLKSLIEQHEKFLQEKATRDSNWKAQQIITVQERLAETQKKEVVYDAGKEPVAASSPGLPLISLRPDKPEEPAQNQLEEYITQDQIENIEAIVREAGVPQNISRQTASQIHQYLKLTTGEGLTVIPQALRERVETILSRQEGLVFTPQQVAQITERLSTSGAQQSSAYSSPYTHSEKPLRPSSPKTEVQAVGAPDRKAARHQEYLYLLYRGQPYWRTLAGQISPLSWFGKRKDPTQENLKLIQSELQRIQREEPKVYQQYSTIFQAIEGRVNELVEAQTALEKVEFVLPEKLEQAIQNLDETADQVQRIEFDQQTQSLVKRRESKQSLVSSLPRNSQQAFEERRFTSQEVERLGRQEARRLQQNILSSLGIKLRQLFTNPRLGWLRWSLSGALAASTPFLPTLVSIAALGGSASLALAQLKHSGGILKNIGLLAVRLAGISLGPIGTAAAAALNFAEPLLKSLKWVFIGFFAILAFLVIFAITLFHAVFLKETTSVGTISESRYIELTKIAQPGNISNSNLPAEVKYTITVKAKEKNLKNLRINDEFSVYGKSNPSPPANRQHSINPSLAAGESQTFDFTTILGQEFQDSLVTNIVAVTADVENGPSGEKASRSAIVTVGTPTTGCFAFKSGWTNSTEQAQITEMINRVAISPAYMTGLCRGGPIDLIRSHTNPGYGGEVRNQKDLYIYDRAFYREGGYVWQNLFYTFAHETGHVYGWRNPATYPSFAIDVQEDYLPTYTLTKSIDEDFAETIAVYIVRKAVPNLSGYNIINMNTSYPKHYQFARDRIFNGFDGF